MKRFRIRYRDDSTSPVFSLVVHADDKERAIERFYGSDDIGWEIVDVKPLPTRPRREVRS